MKKARAILWTFVLLMTLLICTAAAGIWMFRGVPGYYRASRWSPQQHAAITNSADQKLLDIYSWAAAVQARIVRHQRATPLTDDPPIGPKTVAFNQDEFNSILDEVENTQQSRLKKVVDPYFSNEQLILQDDEIILAGQSKDFGTVVSAQFEPYIDQEGKLHFELSGLAAGQLPLPQSLVVNHMNRLNRSLQQRLALYQQSARIDAKFTANISASLSVVTRLLLDSLHGRTSDSIICIPFDVTDSRRQLPVRVTQLKIEAGTLTATLAPVDENDPAAILDRITLPYN